MRSRSFILVALVAIAAFAFATASFGITLFQPRTSVAASGAEAAASPTPAAMRQITVIGRGEAQAAPDLATVHLGVYTEAATAKDAFADNNAKMQVLLNQLKELGIADSAIQTSNISIYGRQDGPSGSVTAYQANNSVLVTIRDVNKTAEVLEKVVAAGANNLSSISFGIAEPAVLEQAAREKALANARVRAEALAAESGATLGQIVTISENVGMAPPMPYGAGMAGGEMGAAGPVQAGEQTVTAYLQVTFELK